jgi:hypothetical protein
MRPRGLEPPRLRVLHEQGVAHIPAELGDFAANEVPADPTRPEDLALGRNFRRRLKLVDVIRAGDAPVPPVLDSRGEAPPQYGRDEDEAA